ncbi:MAG: DUF899 family protein, partial [Pseudomonadota bacterium]
GQVGCGAIVVEWLAAGDLLGRERRANSVFAKDEDGRVYHTYSTYARGNDQLFFPFQFLDLTPRGRNETEGTMSWLRLHDEYGNGAGRTCHG